VTRATEYLNRAELRGIARLVDLTVRGKPSRTRSRNASATVDDRLCGHNSAPAAHYIPLTFPLSPAYVVTVKRCIASSIGFFRFQKTWVSRYYLTAAGDRRYIPNVYATPGVGRSIAAARPQTSRTFSSAIGTPHPIAFPAPEGGGG